MLTSRRRAAGKPQSYGRTHPGTLKAALAAAAILAVLITAALISLWGKPALLGLDVEGGHVHLDVPAGDTSIWWGPFETDALPACRLGVEVSLSEGTLDLVRGGKGPELAFGSKDRLAWRCSGADDLAGQTPPKSNVEVSDATLPFTGLLTLGDQVSLVNALYGAPPANAAEARSRAEPWLIDEGTAWARIPAGGEHELKLHPGDQLSFQGRPNGVPDYGAITVHDGKIRTVAWTRGQGVTVARWGQGLAAKELIAPSALDRLQSAPIWALITVAAGLAIAVIGVWATHMSTRSLFEQAERHHLGNHR